MSAEAGVPEVVPEDEKRVNVGYAVLATYAWGWVSGLVVYLAVKDNKFLKWNGMQSIILSAIAMVASIILGLIPFVGWFLAFAISIAALVFVVITVVKAFKGEKYKVPGIGKLADKAVKY